MNSLGALIMDCRAIEGEDRLILYGWAAQLEEGNDMLYCSKETVAGFLGLSVRTIQRRTKALVKLRLMIDTGERKQWRFGWTPVYTINVPMIVELSEARPDRLSPPDKLSARQIVAQGSNGLSGVRFPARFPSSSVAVAEATGLQPVGGEPLPKSKDEGQTENRRTNPNPKTCPRCGLPWTRDKNHVCSGLKDEFGDLMDHGHEVSEAIRRHAPLDNWNEL